MESAGLDDITLKRLMLANYRGYYLDDTAVLIQLSAEDISQIGCPASVTDKSYEYSSNKTYPFVVAYGDEDEGRGKDGGVYLKTTGAIHIEYKGEQLIYFPEEVLKDEIYGKHYLGALAVENDDYADNVKDFLEKTYTYGGVGGTTDPKTGAVTGQQSGIIKFRLIEDETKTTWFYENIGETRYMERDTNSKLVLSQYDIVSKTSQYTTPMEFMIHLMEITGSRDFINAFIESCVEETKIEMEMFRTTYKENTEEIEKSTKNSVVTGKKEAINYTVKVISGPATKDDLKLTSTKIPDKEAVNVTITSPSKKTCRVSLVTNDVQSPIVISLNSTNNWQHTWTNLSKPDQTEKTKEDTSNVIITKTTSHEEERYNIEPVKVSTWYQELSRSLTKSTIETYKTVTETGEEVDIRSENDTVKISQADRNNTYTKSSNPTVFNYAAGIVGRLSEEECLSREVFYTINKPETDYDPADYVFDKLETKETNITTETLKTTTYQTINQTASLPTVVEKPDIFLSLLSNAHGTYVKGSSFVSKKSGGKVVEYADLYKGTAEAGELLENGARVLFNLLESEYSSCKGLADVMKWLMYLYSDGEVNYGITSFQYAVLNLNVFQNISTGVITGNSVQEKVWKSLKDLGYSDISIAAAMGNIHYESGSFNPASIEGGYTEATIEKAGIGICQWTNTDRGPTGRNTNLRAYAASKGKDWTDENIQVEFLLSELGASTDADPYTDNQLLYSTYTGTTYDPEEWKNATDTENLDEAKLKRLVEVFCFTFERPGTKYGYASLDTRFQHALTYYNQYHNSVILGGTDNGTTGGTPTPTPTPGGTNGGTDVNIGAGTQTLYFRKFTSNITGRTYYAYNQMNEKGYRMGNGCDNACAATIASGYVDKVDPNNRTGNLAGLSDDVFALADAYQYWHPTNGRLPLETHSKLFFDKYGLKAEVNPEAYSMENIRKRLVQGQYVCLWFVTPNNTITGKSGATVSKAGSMHWITIIGYDYNGGSEKIYVANPGWSAGNGWKDIDEFEGIKGYLGKYVVVSEK